MRVLVTGSGGREHALVWKLAQSPHASQVLAAPGNDGMAQARCFPAVDAGDAAALRRLCAEQRVDLVVMGPEAPIAAGVGDRLREAGVAVFAPCAAAARLESSKSFAREFMARHGIPQPRFAHFDSLAEARAHVRGQGPCVVKADGLAAGKGVAVCDGPAQAEAALDEMMGARRFGAAGDRVLVEERLHGEEASFYAITDGEQVVALPAAQDHKRALDGDRGENTGGMGAYAPAPLVDEALAKRVLEEIIHPTLAGLRAEGAPYRGVLYAGLMIGPDRAPRVVEFNVRFGDPETQPLMLQMQGDLLPLLDGAARGRLEPAPPQGEGAAVCVVLASAGYPRAFETGRAIHGLAQAEALPGVVLFHSGAKRVGPGGPEGGPGEGFVTAGGRVLGVTAHAPDLAEARRRAYAAAGRIHFEGMVLRSDIAARGLAR